jgi:predicted ATPase
MRLRTVAVTGLFGVFDHQVELEHHARVTIIHGPNGYGKTVILRMIAALSEGTLTIFEHTPFTEFCLGFDDGRKIVVRKAQVEADPKSPITVKLFTIDAFGNESAAPREDLTDKIPASVLATVDRRIPPPYRLSGAKWTDGSSSLNLSEILALFPAALESVPLRYRPRPFANLLREMSVFFVETNRLNAERAYVPKERQVRMFSAEGDDGEGAAPLPRIKQYSQDIIQRIGIVLSEYAKRSQENDRTFPERLVSFVRGQNQALAPAQILSQMADLENKRRRLISLGLLDQESGLRDLSEDDIGRVPEALTIYVADIQEKLKVFDDISHRIGSLVDIINDRFNYKELKVHRQRGFIVVGENQEPVQLEDLSSGEQHEMIVLYELLFRSPRKGLILVDEPEISLHVAWQSRFLNDLLGILEITDAYAIVATHSPAIIGTRWDLTRELEGPSIHAV